MPPTPIFRHYLVQMGLLIILSACGLSPGDAPSQPGKLKVVATTTIVGDIVHQIGGEAIEVTVLVALHDLKMAAERFDRVMLLNHRLLGLGRPDEVFEPQTLMGAYGDHLRLIPSDGSFLAVEDTCLETCLVCGTLTCG